MGRRLHKAKKSNTPHDWTLPVCRICSQNFSRSRKDNDFNNRQLLSQALAEELTSNL